MSIRWRLRSRLGGGVLIGVLVGVFALLWWAIAERPPIKVGILHAQSGTMAISGAGVIAATQLAIDMLNKRQNGLLGRKVVAVIADTASDPVTAARAAERLITEDKVAAIFGCWTSSCRKTVLPVFERHGHLLFYPASYEGLEKSPNIVYAGATANQQIMPALMWALGRGYRRLYLVGSDYVFPRAANAIISDYLQRWRGEIVGEEYRPLGACDWRKTAERIALAKPHVIVNTINGDSNKGFLSALRAAGISPPHIPMISFAISEPELKSIDPALVTGDYSAWTYFQSIASDANSKFLDGLKNYGDGEMAAVGDPMEAAYVSVLLWAKAVEAANTDAVGRVRAKLGHRSVNGPGGMAYLDPDTQHLWKTVRIGQIRDDGQFEIVWTSDGPVRPEPYPQPEIRSREQWQKFLGDLYDSWGGRWENPELVSCK